MRSKVAERILEKTPEDVKIFTRLYGDLLVRINSIIKEKGYTQKALALKLEKRPSEIHKWLNGDHNFTLRSLAKLQAELGETLLEVPVKITCANFNTSYGKSTFKVYKTVAPKSERKDNWQYTTIHDNETALANAG